jgi:hypothetical protein
MKKTHLITMRDTKVLECFVSDSPSGVEFDVPESWEESIVRLEKVGPSIPPLFSDVSEGVQVVMDVEVTADGLEQTQQLSVEGQVITFNSNITESETMLNFRIILDTGNRFYCVEVSREAGSDGWAESEYEVTRDASKEEFEKTNEILELDEDAIWVPVGTVNSFGVKKQA